VERFVFVEVVPVGGPDLVGVKVLLVDPASAVPQLAVALVAGGLRVSPLVHLELGAVLEGHRVVAVPPVGLVMDAWGLEARASSGARVVLRLVVGSVVEHRAGSITPAVGVQGIVVAWDHGRVKSCGRVVVLDLVDDLGLEDVAGLLGDALADELVVDLDIGDIALVAWDDSSLLSDRALARHIVVGGPVEIVVRPAKELVLLEALRAPSVAKAELGLRLKELAMH